MFLDEENYLDPIKFVFRPFCRTEWLNYLGGQSIMRTRQRAHIDPTDSLATFDTINYGSFLKYF